jgi:hypothetical protein
MAGAMNPDLLRYIEENRATYTREAIRQRLIDAGYPAAEVDAAWTAVEAGEAPPLPPPPSPVQPDAPAASRPAPADRPTLGRSFRTANSPAFWLTLIGYLGLMFLGLPILGVATDRGDDAAAAVGLTYLALWLAGLIGGLLLLRRNRPVGMALLLGFALVIGIPAALGFLAIVVIAGICAVMAFPQR